MSPAHVTGRARELADRLRQDIECSTTREEHIRVSARANEAALLLQDLMTFLDERASLIMPTGTSATNAGLEG